MYIHVCVYVYMSTLNRPEIIRNRPRSELLHRKCTLNVPRWPPSAILTGPILGDFGPQNRSKKLSRKALGIQACHFSIWGCFWGTLGRSWGVILEPKLTKNAKK